MTTTLRDVFARAICSAWGEPDTISPVRMDYLAADAILATPEMAWLRRHCLGADQYDGCPPTVAEWVMS